MDEELIKNLEYIALCAKRAIEQEKGEMEILGKWYIKQQLDEISRSTKSARLIHSGRQRTLEF